MKACACDQSADFLAGLLSDAEESAFVAHLDACVACQRQLELEAGDRLEWQRAKAWLSAAEADDRATMALAGRQGDVVDDPASTRSVASFLRPSDDPAMLGRLGTLEVVGVLGSGGMGVVLKCFDSSLRRNVAAKVLAPALADHGAARRRFAREARAMAAISHEHVVPIYAVDEQADQPYLVMEYVPGGTLERRLQRQGALGAVEVIRVGLQVASALAAAHRQGLVHRDVKP
ncbi:MAG: serine/threonine protein kinase, partial [Planctomycetales bacterium]|nr:serine/threonine protein kinase [Planctomycetales bacterium]